MSIDAPAYPLGPAPAPSLPVGRLPSLGPEEDAADAADILEVLGVWRRRQQRRGAAEPVKLARECLDRWWEKRRRVNDPVTKQYLRSYPWSPGAATLLGLHLTTAEPLASRLVLEHMWPTNGVLARVTTHLDVLDAKTLAGCLQHELGYVIILKSEDEALGKAGMRDPWLADPWDRYRAAALPDPLRQALDPAGFVVPGTT